MNVRDYEKRVKRALLELCETQDMHDANSDHGWPKDSTMIYWNNQLCKTLNKMADEEE